MLFQHVVVPGHTKQTLLKQRLVSQMSLISKLGVPVATQYCPLPALSFADCTNVLHHPGSSDGGQRDHQGQLLRRNIQQLLASNRHNFETRRSGISSKQFQAINFGLCGTLQGGFYIET